MMRDSGEFFGTTKSVSSMIGAMAKCPLNFLPVLVGLNTFFSLPEDSSSEHSSRLVPLSDDGLSSIYFVCETITGVSRFLRNSDGTIRFLDLNVFPRKVEFLVSLTFLDLKDILELL